jgi:tetratricopeptide (TPR) repeat protein
VESRAPWQALQERLTNARAAVEAGERARALAEITAALDIDPDFLAAHSLRDRILATEPASPAQAAPAATSAPPPGAGPVSTEGYAKFEQRAKRRRVDRRLEAARAAIDGGRLKAAEAALEEVIELDSNLPELPELAQRFDALRRRATASRRGPRLAATGVFAVIVLGASWLHESRSLFSRPMIAAAPLVSTPVPTATIPPEVVAVGATAVLESEPELERKLPALVVEPAIPRASVEPVSAARMPEPIEAPEIVPPPPAVVPAPRVMQESMVIAPVSAPIPPPVAALADDDLLVKQTLQQYRTAYEGLDAQSAHAVWPAVNQAALARAFDGLESQSLTFDACDVRVRGESAIAICQGSARYVPKIGNRQPRTEPRVWNFSLRKAGADWKIDSARAER